MMVRACLAISTLRSSVWFSGPVPRIQKLPSSNSGMNSVPSYGNQGRLYPISPVIRISTVSPAVLQAELELPDVAGFHKADEEVVPAGLRFLNDNMHSTGVSVRASIRAPARDKA